jgi:hypothetical protein
VHNPVVIAPPAVSAVGAAAAHTFAAPLHITLPIASLSTNVRVNADSSEDLTAPDDNHDSSVLSSTDLKSMPIFDNDYATAMSAFLDDSASGTGGSGLVVDGVEANRATVSASAVQEVRINQDPYSAQYYWPGRGQMEIVTKSAADRYHGEFNFLFRDNALNAQNALAPTKPFEQRRVYEGHATGPIFFAPKSSFLATFNRAEEDLNSVVSATVAPTPSDPTGAFQANVPAPARDTEFSLRTAHQFGDRHSGYVQYSFQNWTGQNQGVGNQTLASAGTNQQYREDDFVAHLDSTLSAVLLNQVSLVGEHDSSDHTNVAEAPRISVSGDFTGGSAQNDSLGTEYNFRLYDMVTWTRGRHLVKAGIGIPHISRRAFDDNTNALGTYTFGPTLAADGVNVLQTALQNYANNRPSSYSQNTGDVHFIYHQQEAGAFIQDQFKVNDRFSITPGLRYDWQNFLANRRLGFAPRVSFAWVLDPDAKVVLRGGGGIYYDRFGSGPLLDLVRYQNARRRSIQFSFDPALAPTTGCVPVTNCETITGQPPNLAQLAPNAQIPYQMQYGLSIERQLGEHATGTISVYSARGIHEFRSVDVNAPTPDSGYTVRPDPAFGLIRLRASSRAAASISLIAVASTNTSLASAATPGPITNPTPAASAGSHRTSTPPTTSGPTPVLTAASASASMPCLTGIASSTCPPASSPTAAGPGPSSPAQTPTATPSSIPGPMASPPTPRPLHPMWTSTCAGATILRSPPTRERKRLVLASPPPPSTSSTTRTPLPSTQWSPRLTSAM